MNNTTQLRSLLPLALCLGTLACDLDDKELRVELGCPEIQTIDDLGTVPRGFPVEVARMIEASTGNYAGQLELTSLEDSVAVTVQVSYDGGSVRHNPHSLNEDVPLNDPEECLFGRVEFDATLSITTADGRLDEVLPVVMVVYVDSFVTPTFSVELDFGSLNGDLKLADLSSEHAVIGAALYGRFRGEELILSVLAKHPLELEPGFDYSQLAASSIFRGDANSPCGLCAGTEYCEHAVFHSEGVIDFSCQPSPQSCFWSDGPLCECIDDSSICEQGAEFGWCLNEGDGPVTIICESQ